MEKVVNHSNNRHASPIDYYYTWAIERYWWDEQSNIQLRNTMYNYNDGKWDMKFSGDIYGTKHRNPASSFNIYKLGNLEEYQIGWWHETRTKLIIGIFKLNWNTHILKFYRGSGGIVLGIGYERNGTVNEESLNTKMIFHGYCCVSIGCDDVETIEYGEVQYQ